MVSLFLRVSGFFHVETLICTLERSRVYTWWIWKKSPPSSLVHERKVNKMETREEEPGFHCGLRWHGVLLSWSFATELMWMSREFAYVYEKEVWLLLTVEFFGYLHAVLHALVEIDLTTCSHKTSLYRERFILNEINVSFPYASIQRTFHTASVYRGLV